MEDRENMNILKFEDFEAETPMSADDFSDSDLREIAFKIKGNQFDIKMSDVMGISPGSSLPKAHRPSFPFKLQNGKKVSVDYTNKRHPIIREY